MTQQLYTFGIYDSASTPNQGAFAIKEWRYSSSPELPVTSGTDVAALSDAGYPLPPEPGIDYFYRYNPVTGEWSAGFALVSDNPNNWNSSELEAARRAERNARFLEVDHTMRPDVPISPALRAEFAAYIQALRDLPATDPGWPHDITWPVPPVYEKA